MNIRYFVVMLLLAGVIILGLLIDSSPATIGAALVSIGITVAFLILDNKALSPRLIGMLLFLVILLLGTQGWKFFSAPSMMPEDGFNIAVAEFGQLDAGGSVHSSENGRSLSQQLFDQLRNEYQTVPKTDKPNIWHDSLPWSEKRVDTSIGLIVGDTPNLRALAAAKLAQRINADIIVYGNVTESADHIIFAPEFYVAGVPDAAQTEAAEISGSEQLGSAITVPLQGARPSIPEKLKVRVTTLAQLILGLYWMFADEPSKALGYFQKAADTTDKESEEIIYYYIGLENLALRNYVEAEKAFSKSLEPKLDHPKTDYARSRIGLGIVYYERARLIPVEKRLEADDLSKAIKEFNKALESSRSSGSTVEINAHRLLGTAYRVQAEAYSYTGYTEIAERHYDEAIQEITIALSMMGFDGPVTQTNLEDHDIYHLQIAARAYNGLGAAYHQKGFISSQRDKERGKALYNKATTAYSSCIEIAETQPLDVFLQGFKTNFCQIGKDAVQRSLNELTGNDQY